MGPPREEPLRLSPMDFLVQQSQESRLVSRSQGWPWVALKVRTRYSARVGCESMPAYAYEDVRSRSRVCARLRTDLWLGVRRGPDGFRWARGARLRVAWAPSPLG
jgi:hypothetical protein